MSGSGEQVSASEARAFLEREEANLRHLQDCRFEVVAELGRKEMRLSEVRSLKEGEVIDLDKLAGEAFEIRVNDHVYAEGEIVVITDMMAIRITNMHHPEDALPHPRLQLPEPQEVATPDAQGAGEAEGDRPQEKMILIPEGSFTMGSEDGDDTRPAHSAYLLPYFIDAYPVTNQEYREFVQATAHRPPVHWRQGVYEWHDANHPVVNVSWTDACAYAEWAGKRLPTEAEWEKAARGTDARRYPWGDRFVDGERCNSGNMVGRTLPVDEFPLGRSPYGVWDMAGNAGEWCIDYYAADYYQHSPDVVPTGPEGGEARVFRGGSFRGNRVDVSTSTRRFAVPHTTPDHVGFRCAVDA